MKNKPLILLALASLFFQTQLASGNSQLDHQYSLETVGALKAWDNVDGLFTQYIDDAYKNYFSKQSRYKWVDTEPSLKTIQKSKLPYDKIIEDKEVLSEVARNSRAQTLLKTKVLKEGPNYRFQIDWMHAPRMNVLAQEEIVLEQPAPGKSFGAYEINEKISGALNRMNDRFPIKGKITGRDQESVTVDIGRNQRVKVGDELAISSIEDVKIHPITKHIVDWRFDPIGRVQVTSIDDQIAFAKILYEEQGRQITRSQKITQIIPGGSPGTTAATTATGTSGTKTTHRTIYDEHGNIITESSSDDEDKPFIAPTLGWVAFGLNLGSYSRDYTDTSLSPNQGRSGSGFYFGGKAEGELWLKKTLFVDLGFAYGVSSFTPKDISTGQETTSKIEASMSDVKLAVGYMNYFTSDLYGPKVWFRLGYHSLKYSVTANTAEYTVPISHSGLFIGLGGDFPLRPRYGALLNLDFGLFKSATETPQFSGPATGSTDVNFFVGGYYFVTKQFRLRLGVDATFNTVQFANATANQKIVTFGPSIQYYF